VRDIQRQNSALTILLSEIQPRLTVSPPLSQNPTPNLTKTVVVGLSSTPSLCACLVLPRHSVEFEGFVVSSVT